MPGNTHSRVAMQTPLIFLLCGGGNFPHTKEKLSVPVGPKAGHTQKGF